MNARMLLAGMAALALGVAAPALAEPTDAASKVTHNPFLKAGIRLYNDLEFNAALEQLKRAESFPGNTLRDDVLVHIYEGIVNFENNNRDAAQTEFTTALALDPNAQLPRNVSPKIADLFSSVRTKLQKEKEVVTPTVPNPPPQETHPPAIAQPPQTAPQPPAGGLQASSTAPEAKSTPLAPWILVGSAAVLAGVGTVFAVHAHSQGNDAQNAFYQDDASSSLGSAKTSAVVAYSALGVAVAAAAAGVTLLVLDGHSDSASTSIEDR